jgi:glucose/mannose-6-phosphate isomerase
VSKLLPDGPIDTAGVRAAFLAAPEHLSAALDAGPVAGLPASTGIDHVVVVAPGAGRTAAEVAQVIAAPVASIPVIVHPSGLLPAYASARSLVIVAAVDDDPLALLAAQDAAGRGAQTVVVAPDGSELAAEAARRAQLHVSVDIDVPVARAAIGALAVHFLAVLEQLGQYADVEAAVSAAITQLERRRDELTATASVAAKLARRIGRLLPIFYGSDELAGVAARHWKRQVNLNAKAGAFAASLPHLGWDEISGWGQHGDMTRQVFTLVTLRHDHEAPGAPAAMAAVEELVDEVVHERHEVVAEGNGPLAQVLDLLFQGDLTSWHLAQELEIDPGPTAAVATVWSRT